MSNPFAWSPGPKEAQNDSDLRRKRPADQHHASSGQPSHRLCFFAPAFMDASARLWWPGIHVPPTGLPFTSPATPAVVSTYLGSVLHLLFVQLKTVDCASLSPRHTCTKFTGVVAVSSVL